jgi:hypothetical protein
MSKRAFLLKSIFALMILLITAPCYAQLANITNGLNYLTSTQNTDGSWGGDSSSADVLPTTGEAIDTFKILNQTGSSNMSFSNGSRKFPLL